MTPVSNHNSMNEKLIALTLPGANGTPQVIQAPDGVPSGGLGGEGGKILGLGITVFLVACVILALVFLVYGGLNYIMSEGDKTKVESARRTIVYAIIGLLVAFFSFVIVEFFMKFIDPNLSIFNLSL